MSLSMGVESANSELDKSAAMQVVALTHEPTSSSVDSQAQEVANNSHLLWMNSHNQRDELLFATS